MKSSSSIQITQSDFNKLQNLLQNVPWEDKSNREALARELQRAKILASDEIPSDVITLHSRARLSETDTGDILELTIVLPEEVDVEAGKISILAPLGIAMLGYRKGDSFEWNMPGGVSRFGIEEILFQPEASLRAESPLTSSATNREA